MNVKIIFPWSFPWMRGMPLQPLHHQTPPSPTLFHRKGFANRSLETSKKVGKIKGNGLGPGERCETKWRISPKKRPNFWMEGPGAKKSKNVWFCSGWPCAMGFQDSVTFCSYGLFFSMNVIFEIIEIYRVDFVLCSRAPVPRLVRGLDHWAQTPLVSWERGICLQKAECEGGRRGRRTTFGQVSLPSTCRSPPSPSHSLDSLV